MYLIPNLRPLLDSKITRFEKFLFFTVEYSNTFETLEHADQYFRKSILPTPSPENISFSPTTETIAAERVRKFAIISVTSHAN